MYNSNKYFQAAQEDANSRFFSADGYNYADDQMLSDRYDYANGGAPGVPAGFAGNSGFGYADANQAPQTSQPYIVTLTNTNTASAVSSPVLLNAYSALYAPNFGFSTDIVVSMGVAGVTYGQFLSQASLKPFSVGMTYIQAGSLAQALETITITTKDATGNQNTMPITPAIDPYQQQQTIVSVKQAYVIDGFTSLTLNSLAPDATVTFRFYPTENVNLARGLVNVPVARGYGNPGIVNQDKVQVVLPGRR